MPCAFRSDNCYLCSIGDQCRRDGGWRDELRRTTIADDCMIAVIAFGNHRFAVFHREQSEAAAVIPTAWTLAEVSADRGHITDLRTGGIIDRISQHGKALSNFSVTDNVAEAGQGSNR